jgi:hypothetical protein
MPLSRKPPGKHLYAPNQTEIHNPLGDSSAPPVRPRATVFQIPEVEPPPPKANGYLLFVNGYLSLIREALA